MALNECLPEVPRIEQASDDKDNYSFTPCQEDKKFTPLTASFFPFINSATNDIRSIGMSVAMTPRQICIAAKSEINYAFIARGVAGCGPHDPPSCSSPSPR